MNTIFPDKVRTSVAMRVAGGLFILAVVAIAFFATPLLSFAANHESCIGPVDSSSSANDGVPTVTFVAAFSIQPGTKTLTPDRLFNPATAHPPTNGIELVEVKLSNNKIMFGVFRGLRVVMIFEDTATINNPQFVKIK